jgi:ABC-type microcin C transport system duplicated ATPase subunit YejF
MCSMSRSTYPAIFKDIPLPILKSHLNLRGFRGEDLNVIFYQNMPSLNNQYKSTERKIS